MLSGIAPCPGSTIRSAERISATSPDIRTSASGATWRKACATERRFFMLLSTTTIMFMLICHHTASAMRHQSAFEELQAAFCRRNRASRSRIQFGRHAQCAPKCLEHGFALVMRILAAQIVDMQRYQSMIDKTLEKLMRQVDIESADHRTLERHMKFQPGPSGKIDHHT